MNLPIELGNPGKQLRISQETSLHKLRFELMHEVNDPSTSVDNGHPHLGPDLVDRGFDIGIADPTALDAVPNDFPIIGPVAEPRNPIGHVP